MLFSLTKEVEASCPHCPYRETPQFIEVMHTAGHGTVLQLSEYTDRLKRFREATGDCGEWVKKTFARLAGIPSHHLTTTTTTAV